MSGYADWLGRQPVDDRWPAWQREGIDKGYIDGPGEDDHVRADHDRDDVRAEGDDKVVDLDEHRERKRQQSQGERLKEAVADADVDLFHDVEQRTYATFEQDGHRETWPIRSAGFRRYVQYLFYQRNGKAPRAADVADFLATLEGQAQFEGAQRSAYVRIAQTDDGIAIDLGDDGWTALEVDATGWRHVTSPSQRFIRPRGLHALPVPVTGGSIDALRPFLNVVDDEAWRLIVGFTIMMFRPSGPYPVLAFNGQQGSAKSTAMRVLRRLVDPRETLDRAAPRNDHELAIHAMHNRVVALDNLSGLPDWLSDALARLATGSGFSTRQLYTDSDEFSFSAARPVMLNGIGDVIQRSDLLDRAIVAGLAPIEESGRKLEADLWSAFDEARPSILGALLDAVSTAIARESSVRMARWPRMADFARWVTAAAPALGWPETGAGSFLDAYYANRGQAHELVLDADPVAVAVRDLMATIDMWVGRPTALLDLLAKRVGESVTRRKDWPSAANTLSNRLERLAPNLRAVGILVERERDGTARTIRLSNDRDRPSRPSRPSQSRSEAAPAGDGLPVPDDDGPSPDRQGPSQEQRPSTLAGDGRDDDDGLSRRSDNAGSDPESATDDDASPICETCGRHKVPTGDGRFVCTNGPGHPRPGHVNGDDGVPVPAWDPERATDDDAEWPGASA